MSEATDYLAWALERLADLCCDDEGAHSFEDKIRGYALERIAEGAPDAAEIATLALSTREIEFQRWCA